MEVFQDRLETIARDIVYHFPRRGYLGKGMVISVDKYTCVKMFDKVQKYWKDEIKRLVGEVSKKEDERHLKEGLTKEELELFDILKRDKMTKAEKIKVKNAAKHLLHRLLEEKPPVLIQDWYKDSQSQLRVKTAVEEVLDSDLPKTYDKSLFKEKSIQVFELIFEYAAKGLKWAA